MIDYKVRKISYKLAADYIKKNHYTKGICSGGFAYGLYKENGIQNYVLFPIDQFIGVCFFSIPISENVRLSIDKVNKNEVIELSRLHILDITPKNTESYFISRCLKLLKKEHSNYKAVVSYADSTQNHTGIIYKASNFKYLGTTNKKNFYLDQNNRLRSPRQNSVNISTKTALNLGWKISKRNIKHKYVYYL